MKAFKHIKLNIIHIGHQIMKLKFSLVIICSLLLVSCEDFIDIDVPNSEIAGDLVFDNSSTAETAMLGVYTLMRDEPNLYTGGFFGISVYLAHYADVVDVKSPLFAEFPEYWTNAVTPQHNAVLGFWSGSYKAIYSANSVINGLSNSNSAIPDDLKNPLIGEALFTRAFLHFYLVNMFGNVPYIEATDFEQNNLASKITVTEVYEKILADLIEAKRLIPDTYLSSERIRPNKATVSALLARVYLYMEDWDNAEIESTAIINNGLYTLETDITKVFLKDSPSTIWQFGAPGLNQNTPFSQTFNLGFSINSFSDSQLNAFEPGDSRLNNWTVGLLNFSTFMFDTSPQKYKNSTSDATTELIKIFRLGEQYLIRAEARAKLNDIPGAQSDLNQIRNRAGLSDTPASTQSDLIDAILNERRIELFAEHGHRWFDLKRTGKADAVLSVIPVKTGWSATDVLFPIPESEILANENLLPQNDGY